MSLSKLQIITLGCILDVLGYKRPEFDELTPEQNQALIECFNSLVKEKGKGGKSKKSKKSKEKSDDALPKPGNSWIAWLKENRDSIKEQQNAGKEEGLPALLSKEYNAFKKTPAFNALKKDCDEKMKEYKEKSNASDDDEPKKKTKKVEKSSEKKKPLNVYMAYYKKHLDDIKNYVSESGKSFKEAKQEMYAKFKETKEFKTLEAKCKADLKIWNEKEKAPKKQSVDSESDSDDEVVAPKPVVQKPKTKKKEVVSSESESVPVKKADKADKKNVPSDEDEPVKKKKADKKAADKKADKKAKKVEEMPEPKVEKKVEKKKKEVVVEEPPVEDEPEDDHPAEDEYPAEDE